MGNQIERTATGHFRKRVATRQFAVNEYTIEMPGFLSELDVELVRDRVLAHKNIWIPAREVGNREVISFRLGAALYPVYSSFDEYLKLVVGFRPLLLESFSWIYDRLVFELSEFFKTSFFMTDKFGLPGFHIYPPHRYFQENAAVVHRDLMYQKLPGGLGTHKRLEDQFSITLPICLPKIGGGLTIWPDETYATTSWDIKTSTEPHQIDYLPGKLLLFPGTIPHRVTQWMHDDITRITLQCHALNTDDGWMIYW